MAAQNKRLCIGDNLRTLETDFLPCEDQYSRNRLEHLRFSTNTFLVHYTSSTTMTGIVSLTKNIWTIIRNCKHCMQTFHIQCHLNRINWNGYSIRHTWHATIWYHRFLQNRSVKLYILTKESEVAHLFKRKSNSLISFLYSKIKGKKILK